MLKLKQLLHEETARCRAMIETGHKELALVYIDSIDDRIDTLFQDDINNIALKIAEAKGCLATIEAKIYQSEFLEASNGHN